MPLPSFSQLLHSLGLPEQHDVSAGAGGAETAYSAAFFGLPPSNSTVATVEHEQTSGAWPPVLNTPASHPVSGFSSPSRALHPDALPALRENVQPSTLPTRRLCARDGVSSAMQDNRRKGKEGDGRVQCHFTGCGKTFGRRTNRDRHFKNMHMNLPRPRCPVCRKSFSRQDTVRMHAERCRGPPTELEE